MSSGKQMEALTKLFITPQKDNPLTNNFYNSSKTFSSNQKHRKPIFSNSSFNTTGKKHNKTQSIFFKQPLQHYQINNVLSDDFCGCQTTLDTCKRITNKYFKSVSLIQLKNAYQKSPLPNYKITSSSKKVFLNQLPINYPQIYHSQLNNILDHFQAHQITTSNFLLLAWIQFHCKFQYVSYFFYTDLKSSTKPNKFNNQLELELIKYNLNYLEQLQYFKKLNLEINAFINDFIESVGAVMIPVTQYAKFLQIVKEKGQNALVQLIALFIGKKQTQFYTILKYWTNGQISDLRKYSRFLNWELFFDQIKSINYN